MASLLVPGSGGQNLSLSLPGDLREGAGPLLQVFAALSPPLRSYAELAEAFLRESVGPGRCEDFEAVFRAAFAPGERCAHRSAPPSLLQPPAASRRQPRATR